ncbi:ATP-binding protein [Geomonas sp. RF6]|uniref:sensor histidine kinase n=1 Tax=Geomonas sp. RF6 TaxID=2897342 RepID=UPI001E31B795|nr:ATP-binding protein [Geomonas sp. RF6]UFS71293.1 ATP-binding protein [Geomonas sp. RF6]
MAQESAAKGSALARRSKAIVQGVLRRAEHPAALVDYLAQEVRSVSGAAAVAVGRCLDGTVDLLAVAGEGDGPLLDSQQIIDLIRHTCSCGSLSAQEGEAENAAGGAAPSCAAFPLRHGERTIGAILILGLSGHRRGRFLCDQLPTICDVVGLVLSCAVLQEEEESVIAERTRELAEKNAALERSISELRLLNEQLKRDLKKEEGESWSGRADQARSLYQHAPCGFHILDPNGFFIEVNDTELNWLGYRREELLGGRRFTDLLTPEALRTWRKNLPDFKKGGALWGGDFELVRKGGGTFPVFLNAVAIRNAAGELVETRATIFPARELKQAQQELKARNEELKMSRLALLNLVDDLNRKSSEIVEANVRLKDVDQLKSMFIASMSHELRTPLNSVIGFSSILLNEWVGPLNAEQRENLETVLRSGKHLLALVNDVIDVSKVEAGQVERNVDNFDLYEVIEEVAALLDQEIRERGLSLKVNNLHHPMVTDRRRVLQCLINVMGNSAKYTEHGAIEVTARLIPATPSAPESVEIVVEDSGVGIKEEEMGRLFNPFARMDSPLRSSVLGTGLGLYLTRKLLEEVLGGTITAHSVYGEGSRFVMTLPAALAS